MKEPSIEDIARLLRQHRGLVAPVARSLGTGWGVVDRKIRDSKYLQKIRTEIVEESLDFVEDKLNELIEAGNLTAIIFYLKCKGKRRGWVDRVELTAPDSLPLKIDVRLK